MIVLFGLDFVDVMYLITFDLYCLCLVYLLRFVVLFGVFDNFACLIGVVVCNLLGRGCLIGFVVLTLCNLVGYFALLVICLFVYCCCCLFGLLCFDCVYCLEFVSLLVVVLILLFVVFNSVVWWFTFRHILLY